MLRYDEQDCESHYDDRDEADDDSRKGKILFPQGKLFGREAELQQLDDVYKAVVESSQVVFVSGYSGVGKSALIDEWVRQLRKNNTSFMYTIGKYNEHVSTDPFSAITQAMNQLGKNVGEGDAKELLLVQGQLQDSGFIYSDESQLIREIMPDLQTLLGESKTNPEVSSTSERHELKQVVYVFASFLRALCTQQRPLILFLDDLQWADAASLELLASILADLSIPNMMFVGCYRSNDVNEDHPLHKHVSELESKERKIHRIKACNLSPKQIAAFIAETLDLPETGVKALSELVYSKTLGNILFAREAIEELGRKNAIYYDMMIFEWRFHTEGMDLRTVLSEDVIQMVQSKLERLPPKLQRALVLAAYIRDFVNLPTLLAVIQADDGNNDMTTNGLRSLLNQAVCEGLVFQSSGSGTYRYKFAHDKIQEAAHISVPPGDARHRLLIEIATVLLQLSNNESTTTSNLRSNEDWMLFVAVGHFNAVPWSLIDDPIELARLNLRVADLCLRKASFEKAIDLLRSGASCLSQIEEAWTNHYEDCLQLFNKLVETEFAVGNYLETKAAIDEVDKYANNSLGDKCTAHYTKVAMTVETNSRNHAMGAEESVELLRTTYGLNIPIRPTKADIVKEKIRLKIALGTRPMTILSDLPIMQDDRRMKLLGQLAHFSNLAHNTRLTTFVTLRAILISLEKGINKYLPHMISDYTCSLRISGQFRTCYSFAAVVTSIYERFPDDRGGDYAMGICVLRSGILHLKEPFHESIDSFLLCHRIGLAAGNTEVAFTCAMHVPLLYYASGLPLNAQLEQKLILFEAKAKQLSQPGFLVIFQCCRQVLYNLLGRSNNSNPTELKGEVMDEDVVLSQLEGNSKKMTIRDLSIFRLMLAFIFGDVETMQAMMERLESYPIFDLPLVRQHLRVTFHGLAALTLGRTEKNKEHTKQGHNMMKEVRKLDQIGSFNAAPVYMCLKAVDKHKQAAYDEAIFACSKARLMHLEAMMYEHCGRMLLEKNKQELANEYLGRAYWLFTDWGAMAKVKQLGLQFKFLGNYPRRDTNNNTRSSLSSLLIQASRNGHGHEMAGISPLQEDGSLLTPIKKPSSPLASSRFSTDFFSPCRI